jgi:hypothetical protein
MNWSCNQIPMAIPKKLKMSSPKTMDLRIWPEPVEIEEYHFQIRHVNTEKSTSYEHEIPHMP